jgi:Helix-turn-helix domain
VSLVETQHRLALEQLRRAGEQPVSLAALRAAGLDSPAAVISELELNGHVIETRYRKTQIKERQREDSRLHKALEDTGIKLDCVATDILGKSGRDMLDGGAGAGV